jgi:hypothetical protein
MTPEGTDLAIWTYEASTSRGERPAAIAFVAKQSKPLFHHSYVNEGQRQRDIERAIESRKAVFAEKERRQQERRDFKHEFNVGDILDSSWGYDQTNVDFYQVTKVIGPQMVEIREIQSKMDPSSSDTADYVVPVPNHFVGPALKKKVSPSHNVKITSYAYASKWNGRPQYKTPGHMGH